MSRLFGFLGEKPVNLACSFVEENAVPSAPAKPKGDGWGIGFFRNNSSFIFKKVTKPSSKQFFSSVSEVISSQIFISHNRIATIGDKKEANTQPFRWGNWLFAHSGTIHHFRKIKSRMARKLPTAYKRQLQGNTDSEYCFYYYLTFLRGEGGIKKGDSSREAAVLGLKEFGQAMMAICEETEVEKMPELNFMISNGNYLLSARYGETPFYYKVYENATDADMFFHSKQTCTQFSLVNLENDNRFIVIATDTLTDSSSWKEVPDKHVLVADANLSVEVVPWID